MAKILIVDDDPQTRTLLVDLPQYEGHVLIQSVNGTEGLKAAERENPDLVITDGRMPSMSGGEFIASLRDLPHMLATPVILYTGAYDDRDIRETAAAYRVVCILTKPCPARVVLAEIASALSAPPQESFRGTPANVEKLRA